MAVDTQVIRDEALLDRLTAARAEILREIRKAVLGQDEAVEQVLLSLFVGGHQVRCELNALERKIEDVGDRADEQCLGETGHAGDDRVTADKQREQDLLDHFILADDGLPDFAQQALAR